MSKERVASDLHFHGYESDGNHSPGEMALAARQKAGERPLALALTDHDYAKLAGQEEFYQACQELGAIPVGGVEILCRSQSLDIRDPRVSEEVRQAAIGSFIESILAQDDYPSPRWQRLQKNLLENQVPTGVLFQDLHALEPKEFFLRHPFVTNSYTPQFWQSLRQETLTLRQRFAPTEEPLPTQIEQSEILCYFPPRIWRSVRRAIYDLHRYNWPQGAPSLNQLMDFLITNVGKKGHHFKDLVFILAHPLSLDLTWWGKYLKDYHFGPDIHQVTTELAAPELRRFFSGAEKINATHPVTINQNAAWLLKNRSPYGLYYGLGPSFTGNSDAHHKNWVFAAGSAITVEEETPEGILAALRNGQVEAFWGLKTASWPLVGNLTPFLGFMLLSRLANNPGIGRDELEKIAGRLLGLAAKKIGPQIPKLIRLPNLELP